MIDRRGYWQMDDYLHFVEAHSLYLFRGEVLDPKVCQAWELLRVVVLHYFRAMTEEHDTFPFTEEACQRAEQAMLDFAQLMEEVKLLSLVLLADLSVSGAFKAVGTSLKRLLLLTLFLMEEPLAQTPHLCPAWTAPLTKHCAVNRPSAADFLPSSMLLCTGRH